MTLDLPAVGIWTGTLDLVPRRRDAGPGGGGRSPAAGTPRGGDAVGSGGIGGDHGEVVLDADVQKSARCPVEFAQDGAVAESATVVHRGQSVHRSGGRPNRRQGDEGRRRPLCGTAVLQARDRRRDQESG